MTDRPNSEDAHRVPGKLESDPEDDERLLADNRSDDAVGPSDAPVAEDPAMSTHGPTEESSDPLVSHRHPTGEPELTGGWMSDSELNVQPPNLGTSAPPPEPSAGEKLDPNETPKRPFPEEVEAAPGLTAATEDDIDATRVSPSAITSMIPDEPTASSSRERLQGCGSCMIRMAILGLFVFLAGVIGVVSFGLYQYYALVATLPSVTDLEEHVSQFETTRILDREGNLLYELLDPQAGRRTYVPLTEVSPYMIAAILATEDSQFYSHPGFDPMAIGRAVWQNYSSGGVVSGASTITQQVARNLLFDPEERTRITARRKTREILLAAEITRRYSKEEILELYLNESYFGNLAYGVEAAAETYFNTTADKLTLPQASFLAGLVQAPSVYDIFTNREATLERHRQVLTLMVETSNEQGCIFVQEGQQPICVTPEQAGAAAAEITNYEFRPPLIQMRFPHWVNFIRTELEGLFDPQTIFRSGFTVYTTLDPILQQKAQESVREQVEQLADNRATNGALVALEPSTGEILAMVGSPDFYNEEIDGQINMAVAPRQPGSALKPLTYTAAFEKGWTPATLIWDVPSEFPPSGEPNDPRPPYEPVNYDEKFHGPVTVRSALGNSYNVPAVKALDYVGIYDDPDAPGQGGLVEFAERLGITTLNRDDYGLALTLGGGDVSLLELTAAYATYANQGLRIPPAGILRIEDRQGAVVYEYEPPEGEEVIRPDHAHLITSIISDNNARTPAFGPNSALKLPFPAAAKTGTTNDFRDNWTLGFTPEFAVGVWVGNADYSPMENTSGLSGAAPIWNEVMQFAAERYSAGQPGSFSPPRGIEDHVICSISGTQPSEWCSSQRTELFASDQPPLPPEKDLWRKPWIDTFSLELASAACPDYAKEKLGLYVDDPWGRKWIEETDEGEAWAEEMGFGEDEDQVKLFFIPDATCSEDSPRPKLAFTSPTDGALLFDSPIEVYGIASATKEFKDWILEYGIGDSPSSWPDIAHSETAFDQPEKLLDWDIHNFENGRVVLRLTVRSERGGSASVILPLNILLPTPTASPTASPTPTSTVTPTSTSTNTPSPSLTPTP